MPNKTLIHLDEKDLFATGGRREVYFHPHDPDKCIKVTMTDDLIQRRQKAAWYKKLRPLSFFDENRTDFVAYKSIRKKGDHLYKHIPQIYGYCETNKGPGLVVELIRNKSDNLPVIALDSWIKQFGLSAELDRAIDEVFQFTLRHNFLTRTLRDFNLCVQKQEDHSLKIYIIDGFGTAVNLPFFEKITPLVRNKIKRQHTRAIAFLKKAHPAILTTLKEQV